MPLILCIHIYIYTTSNGDLVTLGSLWSHFHQWTAGSRLHHLVHCDQRRPRLRQKFRPVEVHGRHEQLVTSMDCFLHMLETTCGFEDFQSLLYWLLTIIVTIWYTNDIHYLYIQIYIYMYILVGGIPTPLKNMSQLGLWHSQYDGKNKMCVPNHQPDYNMDITITDVFSTCFIQHYPT